jgi:L-iditol 2-dehydrogenase
MRALVKYGNKDGEVEIRDVPIPKAGPDDVLIEVKAVGICGWDIEMWRHHMANPVTVPVIQGHEFCGIISGLGSNVSDFAEGERVVCETGAVICGKCSYCLSGNYHVCPQRKGFGYGVDGAFTDYVKVPRRCLHRIPDKISFDHACLTEPACVAYHALVALSTIRPGEPILIIGPGPIGLFCIQIAKACGAGPILVVGTDKDKLRFNIAKKLGADMLMNGSTADARATIDEVTKKQGMPLVVDAAGNEHALALALYAVARQGQITKIGWGPKPVNLSLDPLLSKAARLQGTFSHNWSTWESVLAMMSRGVIQMEPMISHRITIDEWLPTFEAIERCEGVKAVMLFNQSQTKHR